MRVSDVLRSTSSTPSFNEAIFGWYGFSPARHQTAVLGNTRIEQLISGMVRPEVKQRSLILRFTDALGLTGAPETEPSAPAQDSTNDILGFPQVSSVSTLALMVQMSPAAASTYADAVNADLSKCISTFQIDPEGSSVDAVLEQIHSLKNVIAATGSLQLIAACEAMRLDACRRTSLGTLEARYKAVANAAIQAVAIYMRSTTPTLGKGDQYPDGRH